jgi:hypothetical protein
MQFFAGIVLELTLPPVKGTFITCKAAGAGHSLRFTVEVEKTWRYTTTIPIHPHGVLLNSVQILGITAFLDFVHRPKF